MSTENKKDYNDTLNLPKTEFPMRAALPKREPEMLTQWENEDLYEQLMKKIMKNHCMYCTMDLRMQMEIYI